MMVTLYDIDALQKRIAELEAENACLRQQVQSLVEAWAMFKEIRDYYPQFSEDAEKWEELEAAFLAVQSAQETEEP